MNTIGFFIIILAMIGGMVYQTINYRDNNVD